MNIRRSIVSVVSVASLALSSLLFAVVAPTAQAATLSVGSSGSPILCSGLSGTTSQTLSSALGTGDTLEFVYDNCNKFYLFWTSSDFTTSFGSTGFKENGNNLETRSFTNYQGSATAGDVLVTIADASSLASASVKFEIKQGSTAWTAKTPPDGTIGSAYASGSGYQFNAPNGSGDYSHTGDLPPGLSLSTSGLLSGTPTRIGEYTFAVARVGEATTTGDLTVTVSGPVIDKVTICHRTRATTNPYVMITVSVSAVTRSSGHQEHDTTRSNKENPQTGTTSGSGPFDTSYAYPANKKWWGDIIPPFTHSGGTFEGLNWSSDWNSPNPTPGTSDWLEDGEFAAAITGSGASTTSVHYKAAQQCIDLSAGTQSTKSTAMDTPQEYFNVSVENGEDPESIKADLDEQDALDPSNPVVGSPVSVPSVSSLETTYASTADVQTDSASDVAKTTATLNGELKSGSTWTSWKYEWATSRSAVAEGTGSSHTYTPGTDPSSSVGAGATNPEYEATGLTCNTTYYFRIVGTDNASNVSYGLIRSFTTDACTSGVGGGDGSGNSGGGNGNGNGNSDGGTSTTPPTASTPNPGRGLGSGRPLRVVVPIVAQNPGSNPGSSGNAGGGSAGETPGNTSSNPGSAGGSTQSPRPGGPRNVTPTLAVPPPPGDEWVTEGLRLEDPDTGTETLRVVDEQGTWVVNPTTGSVTFTPAPDFVGTATLNVRLVARSGAIAIHPIRVLVGASSRILVLEGDVPGDIKGGVAFRR